MLKEILDAKNKILQAYNEISNLTISATPKNVQSLLIIYTLLDQSRQDLEKEIEELSQVEKNQ